MPTYEDAFVNRGVAHEKNGEFDRALADYDAALKLDPAGGRGILQSRPCAAQEGPIRPRDCRLRQARSELNKKYVAAYFSRAVALRGQDAIR